MTLKEKLMHYTHDLGCGVDLKQEAIATIEHIAQYMDEDKLLHHSRPLAIAYLALTEDTQLQVVRCKDCEHAFINGFGNESGVVLCKLLSSCENVAQVVRQFDDFCSYGKRKEDA